MENTASNATYISSFFIGIWGLSFEQWIGLAGIVIAAVNCAINVYYKRKSSKKGSA